MLKEIIPGLRIQNGLESPVKQIEIDLTQVSVPIYQINKIPKPIQKYLRKQPYEGPTRIVLSFTNGQTHTQLIEKSHLPDIREKLRSIRAGDLKHLVSYGILAAYEPNPYLPLPPIDSPLSHIEIIVQRTPKQY
ncbi:MAG: hypothetical protein M1142_00625 [Patescibacteria group bacterium]|nr:hypothetical protein [Patescibacteria group bacterium]